MFTVIQQPNGHFCAVTLQTAKAGKREALGRYTTYRAAEAAAHDFNKASRIESEELDKIFKEKKARRAAENPAPTAEELSRMFHRR